MKIDPYMIASPFMAHIERRPWGHYGLYSENEVCTCKILFIAKDEMLSMQYHFKRDQFYFVLDDNFIIQYSSIPVPKEILENQDEQQRFKDLELFLEDNLITHQANEGDMFGFHRQVVHRATYVGSNEYGKILDLAFGENDEDDIVRIADKYGRADIDEIL